MMTTIRISIFFVFTFLLITNLSLADNTEINDTTNNTNKIYKNIELLTNNSRSAKDSLLLLAKETLELSIKIQNQEGIEKMYSYIGDVYKHKNLNDSAIFYYELSLKYIKDQDNLASHYWNLSNLHRITGNYSAALEYSLSIKKLVEKKQTSLFKYETYNILALSYQTLMEYDLAKENYERSAKGALKDSNEAYAGIIYANLAKLLFDEGKLNESLKYFEKGIKLEKQYELYGNLANSYIVIARIYLQKQMLDSARNYLFQAAELNRKYDNKTGLTNTLLYVSTFYDLENNLEAAEFHLTRTIKNAKEYNLRNILSKAYKLSAEINAKKSDHKKAYEDLGKFFEIYEQLYNVEKINKAKALEQKLIQQEKENQLFELELEKQKTISTLLLLVVALSIIIGAIAIAFLIHTKRSNKKLKKSTQKAEESDKLKSQFLQTISHEIRTPLNGIIGFSDMILNKDLTDNELKDINELIHKNSYDLTTTIENLVDIAHLTTNQYNIKKTKFELDSLLNNIQNIVEENILLKNKSELKIIFDIPQTIKIYSDRHVLQKTLLHLIKNAISYTNSGSVHVGYNMSGSKLKIFIKDTGIGISKEKLDVIFSPFRQADETINIKVGGTGLGLSIVSKFIELLGGKINVESKVNIGSAFYLTIPIK
jgi:signal transduction histidine kinase